MPVDDSGLLQAWRDGDALAGERLFRRLFGPLRRFFANKVRERGHVEELVAATLEILVKRGEAFEGRSSFLTYALGVARNVLRAYYRQRMRDDAVDVETLPIVEMGAGPFSLLAHGQEQQLLLQGLRRIPLEHQIVLELCFWERMRTSAIAALLGVPIGTATSRLRQGRGRLRRELSALAQDPRLLHDTTHDLEDWAKGIRETLAGMSRSRQPSQREGGS